MSIRKGKADGKIYDIVDREQISTLDRNVYGPMAIEWNGVIYPERNRGDNKPGVYITDWGSYLIHPSEEQIDEYSSDNIIDFKSDNIKELIEKSNKLKDMEREILTSPDNIFIPPLLDNDSPEMRGLKKAVIAKKIDLYKYASRFGSNFQNDRRLFSNTSITMDKLKKFLENLDMKGTLIIEDKSPDVPNPMGCKIIAEIVGGDDE